MKRFLSAPRVFILTISAFSVLMATLPLLLIDTLPRKEFGARSFLRFVFLDLPWLITGFEPESAFAKHTLLPLAFWTVFWLPIAAVLALLVKGLSGTTPRPPSA